MFIGTLLPYQQEAVDRMVERHKMLVAYDLGLGKTVITIAACERLRDESVVSGPVLVVCLTSLKYQWKKEIEKFSDRSVIVIDGGPKKRQQQYADSANFDYIVVNYEQVVNDWDIISELKWLKTFQRPGEKNSTAIVFDEATAIKGFRSKRARKCKELSKQFRCRFGLTGTPMENGRPEELYSIMQAVDKDVFGSRFDLFDQTFIVRNKFGGVERYRNLHVMHDRLKTASVRKTQRDEDVAPHLPQTIDMDPLLVPMERKAQELYRVVAGMLLRDLDDAREMFGDSWSLAWNMESHYGEGSSQYDAQALAFKGRIMSKIVALRQVCDDPKLLVSSAAAFDPFGSNQGSSFCHELFQNDDSLLRIAQSARSTKYDALSALVADHLSVDEQNKVVVFCSYVDAAEQIQRNIGGVLYTGRLSAKEKEAAKQQFQTEPDVRVFVSTDAGGYGVDLPQANMLVNFDLPWSSGTAVQRNGRIKRASSRWPSIVIHTLLAQETIEEWQWDVIQHKTLVATAVVDGQGFDTRGGVDMTVSRLAEFLRGSSV